MKIILYFLPISWLTFAFKGNNFWSGNFCVYKGSNSWIGNYQISRVCVNESSCDRINIWHVSSDYSYQFMHL